MLSRADVIKIVQGIKEFKDMKASDIMTYDITAVEMKEPIRNALEMMRRIDVRTIPVVDEKFKLAGIIGIRDIVNYSWTGGKTAKETRGERVGKPQTRWRSRWSRSCTRRSPRSSRGRP